MGEKREEKRKEKEIGSCCRDRKRDGRVIVQVRVREIRCVVKVVKERI